MTPSTPTPRPTRIRILIAEDFEPFSMVLTRKITQDLAPLIEIVDIVQTTTLQEALELSHTCDVSIVDRCLKGTNAEDTDAALPRFKKPVIILTAYWSQEIEDHCLAQGAQHVFDKSDFKKLVEALLLAAVHGLAREKAAA